jgi:glc operon protein GlcG
MMKTFSSFLVAAALVGVLAGVSQAQLLDRKMISLAEAKKMAAAAHAEAVKQNWRMAIAVVDSAGNLIYLERMDDVQTGSIQVAIDKAKTAAAFNRSTDVLATAVKGNPNATPPQPARPELLKLFPLPAQGGLPIKVGDFFVGAIGCSGGTSPQDEQTCAAGLAVLGK